ncbi:hypothetical protein [Siminovitchia sp. 179-K 8D1 HS]|uniref:hypothetical protein n=1 Tax=Siminovitchia sp. 179-K 8D1 HS TaxID=3142385 RepID=UPI0039A184D3
MSVYFISDTHFSHRKILDFENRLYSSVEEMDECMIENWSSTITDNDIVYHLGDFCLSNQDLNQLNVGVDSDLMLNTFKLKYGQPTSLEQLI